MWSILSRVVYKMVCNNKYIQAPQHLCWVRNAILAPAVPEISCEAFWDQYYNFTTVIMECAVMHRVQSGYFLWAISANLLLFQNFQNDLIENILPLQTFQITAFAYNYTFQRILHHL